MIKMLVYISQLLITVIVILFVIIPGILLIPVFVSFKLIFHSLTQRITKWKT